MSAYANPQVQPLIYHEDWPSIDSRVVKDPTTEAFIHDILVQMSLEEKVGQMIQPDLREVTPEEVAEYKLGTILNGGGAFPKNDKYATARDWVETADEYYQAGRRAFEGRSFHIPFAWATDAVHGVCHRAGFVQQVIAIAWRTLLPLPHIATGIATDTSFSEPAVNANGRVARQVRAQAAVRS